MPARSHTLSPRALDPSRAQDRLMAVPKQKLEEVRQLYRRYTGGEISLEEVEEFGEYIIWWICAANDI